MTRGGTETLGAGCNDQRRKGTVSQRQRWKCEATPRKGIDSMETNGIDTERRRTEATAELSWQMRGIAEELHRDAKAKRNKTKRINAMA